MRWDTGSAAGYLYVYLPTVVVQDWLITTANELSGTTVFKVAAGATAGGMGALPMTHDSGSAPADAANFLIPPNVRAAVGVGGERFAPTVIKLVTTALISEDPADGPLKGALSSTSASDAAGQLPAPPTNWSERERAVADDAQPPRGDILSEPESKLPVVKRKRRRR
jgi:hypothetical protein